MPQDFSECRDVLRAFIAIEISREARDELIEVTSQLKRHGVTGVRWVKPDGIHLTLKFLGDIDPPLVDSLLEAIRTSANGTSPFTIGLAEIGAFPKADSPRVIWAGIEGDAEVLVNLQRRIDQAASLVASIPTETRPFKPHLTLGRTPGNVSTNDRRKIGEALAKVTLNSRVSWLADEIKLIRSTLTPEGAVYNTLGSVKLDPETR